MTWVRGIGRKALLALLLGLALIGAGPGCEQEMEHGTTDAAASGDGGSAGDASPPGDAGMQCPDAGPGGDAGMLDGGPGDGGPGDGGPPDGGLPPCTQPDAGPDAGTSLRMRTRWSALSL